MSIFLPQSLPSTLNPLPKQVIKKKKKKKRRRRTPEMKNGLWPFVCSSYNSAALWWVCLFAPKAKKLQRPFIETDYGAGPWRITVLVVEIVAKMRRPGRRWGGEQQDRHLSCEKRKLVLIREVPELTPSSPAGPTGVLCVFSVHISSLEPCDSSLDTVFLILFWSGAPGHLIRLLSWWRWVKQTCILSFQYSVT